MRDGRRTARFINAQFISIFIYDFYRRRSNNHAHFMRMLVSIMCRRMSGDTTTTLCHSIPLLKACVWEFLLEETEDFFA